MKRGQTNRRSATRYWSAHAAAWVVILLAPAPLLLAHFRRLWLYEHYRFFPLVIVAGAYFLWRRWPENLPDNRIAAPKTEFLLLAFALILLACATMIWSPWLAAIASWVLMTAALLHFAGRAAMARLLPVCLLLVLLISLPLNLDVLLAFKLRTLASQAASNLLDQLEISHLLSGHVLEVPGHRFFVNEACSGIRHVFTLLVAAGILMLALRRGFLHALLILIAAPIWAVLINGVGFATIVFAATRFDLDLSSGQRRDVLEVAILGLGLLMLICTDRLVLFLLERPDDELFIEHYFDDDRDEDGGTLATAAAVNQSSVITRRSVAMFGFAIVYGIVGVLAAIAIVTKPNAWGAIAEVAKIDAAMAPATLPERLGDWTQTGFERINRPWTSIRGPRSAVWTYQHEGAVSHVYVSYPVHSWQQLPACYVARGMTIHSLETNDASVNESAYPEVWTMTVRPPTGTLHVRFSELNDRGDPVPTLGELLGAWRSQALDSWLRSFRVDGPIYRVVMQVEATDSTKALDSEQLTSDFITVHEAIRRTILEIARQ